jgi:[protein-PII] uridylyltransferase
MSTPAELLAARNAIPQGVPSGTRRAAYVAATDAWVEQLASDAGIDTIGGALIAVGGYGRGDLAVRSDLDLVLVHPNSAPSSEVSRVADAIWYPIWDAGVSLDHSVRSMPETRRLAAGELKVALGLLDARRVSGDDALTQSVRSSVLADWRALAANRLGELRDTVQERTAREHELPHLLEPDLKDAYGGLRDATILRAIAASWITDYAHAEVDAAAQRLMDVRDALQQATGRATSRLVMQEQARVAEILGVRSDDLLLREVIDAGRAIAYASDVTWQRVGRLTRKKSVMQRIRPQADERLPLADGVVAQQGEVFLARDARPDRDPLLLLRTAAAAAQAGMLIAPETVARFALSAVEIPQPWPRAARDALVSFLGAGAGTVAVWEALDNAGCFTRLLPYWENVRSLPQRNALHTYTVDRHQVQAAANAAALTRDVTRPDLLLVAALYHDIGKGNGPDHSGQGAAMMQDIGYRLGFSPGDIATLRLLVQQHLLLSEAATRRDPDDPATVRIVADAVVTHETLDLLHALTEADSLATGPAAWSDWKARLIATLVDRVHSAIAGAEVKEVPSLAASYREILGAAGVHVSVARETDGLRVLVAADDRVGLLSTVAAVLATQRLDVLSATLDTQGDRALQSWLTQPAFGDPPDAEVVTSAIRRALEADTDLAASLASLRAMRPTRRGFTPPPPRVRMLEGASDRADVLEVRAHDQPALLWRVTNALADAQVSVVNALVSTLGSEVIDVLYLVEGDGSRLLPHRCSDAIAAVEAALQVG